MRPGLKRFLLGMGAGGASIALSFVLRVTIGTAFLPELAVNALVSHTPGSVESVLVVNLQSLAKYSAFATAIAVNVLLYGFLAYFIGPRAKGGYADRISLYSIVAYLVTFALSAFFLAITQVLSAPQSIPTLILSLIPTQLLFGAVVTGEEKLWPIQAHIQTTIQAPIQTQKGVLCEPLKPPKSKKFDRKRRIFIRAGTAAVVGAALLYLGVGLLFPKTIATSPSDAVAALYGQEVTPTGSFYRVDVNIFPPSVDSNSWTLDVSGMVATPTTFNYAQFTALPQVEQYNTLECVSNTVGGDLISTAKWTGVKLNDILNTAQVQEGATYVVFKAVDGYSVGIPLETAMLDGTILAYQMNDVPLPQEHGYPMRAIVPGLYGMMNAKWVTSIEVVGETYEGYWQVRGWENDAHYNTMSAFVTPGSSQLEDRFGIGGANTVPLGTVPVAGVAFAGDRGIGKVEVSTDGGNTWTPATLKDPLSDYTWVLWMAEWNPPASGNYTLEVRATDGTGAVQTAMISGPFPNGATGYHIVDVGVVSSSSLSS